jgi:hypothetical protein
MRAFTTKYLSTVREGTPMTIEVASDERPPVNDSFERDEES